MLLVRSLQIYLTALALRKGVICRFSRLFPLPPLRWRLAVTLSSTWLAPFFWTVWPSFTFLCFATSEKISIVGKRRGTTFISDRTILYMIHPMKAVGSSMFTARCGAVTNHAQTWMLLRWRCRRINPSYWNWCVVAICNFGRNWRVISVFQVWRIVYHLFKFTSAPTSRSPAVMCITFFDTLKAICNYHNDSGTNISSVLSDGNYSNSAGTMDREHSWRIGRFDIRTAFLNNSILCGGVFTTNSVLPSRADCDSCLASDRACCETFDSLERVFRLRACVPRPLWLIFSGLVQNFCFFGTLSYSHPRMIRFHIFDRGNHRSK